MSEIFAALLAGVLGLLLVILVAWKRARAYFSDGARGALALVAAVVSAGLSGSGVLGYLSSVPGWFPFFMAGLFGSFIVVAALIRNPIAKFFFAGLSITASTGLLFAGISYPTNQAADSASQTSAIAELTRDNATEIRSALSDAGSAKRVHIADAQSAAERLEKVKSAISEDRETRNAASQLARLQEIETKANAGQLGTIKIRALQAEFGMPTEDIDGVWGALSRSALEEQRLRIDRDLDAARSALQAEKLAAESAYSDAQARLEAADRRVAELQERLTEATVQAMTIADQHGSDEWSSHVGRQWEVLVNKLAGLEMIWFQIFLALASAIAVDLAVILLPHGGRRVVAANDNGDGGDEAESPGVTEWLQTAFSRVLPVRGEHTPLSARPASAQLVLPPCSRLPNAEPEPDAPAEEPNPLLVASASPPKSAISEWANHERAERLNRLATYRNAAPDTAIAAAAARAEAGRNSGPRPTAKRTKKRRKA